MKAFVLLWMIILLLGCAPSPTIRTQMLLPEPIQQIRLLPSDSTIHSFQDDRPFSKHFIYHEARKRFKTFIVIKCHGDGAPTGIWKLHPAKKFGTPIPVSILVERYLAKYKDCDIIVWSCNPKGSLLELNVSESEAKRVWYFRKIALSYGRYPLPPLIGFFHNYTGEDWVGSVWELEQAVPYKKYTQDDFPMFLP